jgi:PAS domain S-box-containing protein
MVYNIIWKEVESMIRFIKRQIAPAGAKEDPAAAAGKTNPVADSTPHAQPQPAQKAPPPNIPVASYAPQSAASGAPPAAATASPAAAPRPAGPPVAGQPGQYRSDHKSLYKQLLRGMYDAILVTDPKGHVIDSNERVRDIFQHEPAEVWDMEISKLIPGITPAVLEQIRSGVADKRHVMIDARCMRKDGQFFPGEVAVCSINLINENDLVFSIRDMERRKGRMQLLRSFQGALANDLAGIAVAGRDGRITYANKALRTLWKITKDEDIIGRFLVSLWTGDAQGEQPFQTALAGEHWEGTLVAIASDGSNFKVQASIGTDRSDTEPVGVVCAFLPAKEA